MPSKPGTARWLTSLVALLATGYALYGVFRHRRFASSAFDLGIFDQVVWHLSRFETPASSIRGYSHMFGDHFNVVMVLFVPLYWIKSSPETLIVAQAVLLALSIIPVFLFLRDRLPDGIALTLAGAYGLSWGIQQTAAFDVHEMAFAPLAVATLILAMSRKRWRLFWVMAGAVALTKEDMIPLLSGVGLYLMLRGDRRRGALLFGGSLVCFLLVTAVVIPFFSDAHSFGYTNAYAAILARPWTLPLMLMTPVVKVRTALLWFAPFAFFSLASPLSILVLPLALVRLLSSSPEHWGTSFHYTAPIAPIVAMSAGEGLARLLGMPARQRFLLPAATLCLLLAAVLPGKPPLRLVFTPRHYAPIPSDAAAREALALIPPDASVVALAAIGPHLSERDRAYVLRNDGQDADFVIASTELSPWPLASVAEVRAAIDARLAAGYRRVFSRDGWIVLRRSADN